MDLNREVGNHTEVAWTAAQQREEEIRVTGLGNLLEVPITVDDLEGQYVISQETEAAT